MSFLSDVVSNPSQALGGAFNFGTPGQSGYSASGYAPDPAAFDNPQYAQQYARLQAALQRQQAQQAAASRSQAGLVAALQAQMAGQQPSVAQQQLAQTTAANDQAALASAASAASVDPSLALRNAMQARAANDQNAAGQAALLRAGEQTAGEQTLAGVLGGQQQLATQAALALQGLQGQESQTQTQNQITRQQMQEQAALGSQGINAGVSVSNAQQQGGFVNNLVGGGAAGAAAGLLSDRRAKTDIAPAGKGDVAGLLDALKARLFRYRGENPQPGGAPPHLGILAQDAERSPLGRQMVIDTPQGKAIDPGQAVGALLAASANLNDRLSRLEAVPGSALRVPGHNQAPNRLPETSVAARDDGISAPDGSAWQSGGPGAAPSDAADYFASHEGSDFMAGLNEVGRLGAALEQHHGIRLPPEGLVKLMAAALKQRAA